MHDQTSIAVLLAGALIFPIIGALLLRLLAPRLPDSVAVGAGVLVIAVAIGCTLFLASQNIPSLRIGTLTLVLPVQRLAMEDVPSPPSISATTTVPLPDRLRGISFLATATVSVTHTALVLRDTPIPTPSATITPIHAITRTSTLTTTAIITPTRAITRTLTPIPTATITPTRATTHTLTPTPTVTITPTRATTRTLTPTPTATITPTREVTPTATPTPEPFRYTIKPGDTLPYIAETFHVSVAEILAANGLTEDEQSRLRAGDTIIIPLPTATPESRIYVVKPGDTLSTIAEAFDVSVDDLLAANNLTRSSAPTLKPGDELIIP